MLMLHCRSKTVGSELDNFNNHPLVTAKELSVIHNGTIGNQVALKNKYELPSKGSVDSEVIPMLIHKHAASMHKGDFKKASVVDLLKAINMSACQMEGGFACGLINQNHPDVLYLFNHTNPIVMGYCE
jgi:glucosamine--fructose-6-phosphate aminotransferase (isomerizing)